MKRNRIFRFVSSVKLAIPLMAALTLTVAYGTIVESRYSTEMAQLVIYHAAWFQVLLGLLWLNILCATLSRLPFKRQHTGFVITHIGLLTLLIGAMVTGIWGIDGSLQVAEQGQSSEVVLSDLVFEILNPSTGAKQAFAVPRRLEQAGFDDFQSINNQTIDKASIVSYLPYAKAARSFQASPDGAAGGLGLSFRLKSQFFDVSEWLHSQQNPEFQLGPAHLSLVVHAKGESPRQPRSTTLSHSKKERTLAKAGTGPVIQVMKRGTGELVKEVSLKSLRSGPTEVGPLLIAVTRVFEQAQVGQKGKIEEGGTKGANPAVELSVVHQGSSQREVLFAKFPTFSLHNDGLFGFTLRYLTGDVPSEPAVADAQGMPPNDSIHARLGGAGSGMPGGNVIQFHVYEDRPDRAMVRLLKGGAEVMSQWVKRGETLQTPWMGMKLTLNDLVFNGAESQQVMPASLALRSEMPPSAVRVRPAGAGRDEAFWLMEGDAREIAVNGNRYQLYYGRKTLNLPFRIFLEKFTKADYPGTQTAMSFESLVRINDGSSPTKISMNEPLTLAGFTLYQSSYVLRPGQPALSIFSVNQDPGRLIKYFGSLILVVGIIVFTLMRSRMAKARRGNS